MNVNLFLRTLIVYLQYISMLEYFFLFLKCKLRGQVPRNNLGAQTDERLYKNFSLFFKDITASVIIYKPDQSEYIIFHKSVLFLSREA